MKSDDKSTMGPKTVSTPPCREPVTYVSLSLTGVYGVSYTERNPLLSVIRKCHLISSPTCNGYASVKDRTSQPIFVSPAPMLECNWLSSELISNCRACFRSPKGFSRLPNGAYHLQSDGMISSGGDRLAPFFSRLTSRRCTKSGLLSTFLAETYNSADAGDRVSPYIELYLHHTSPCLGSWEVFSLETFIVKAKPRGSFAYPIITMAIIHATAVAVSAKVIAASLICVVVITAATNVTAIKMSPITEFCTHPLERT